MLTWDNNFLIWACRVNRMHKISSWRWEIVTAVFRVVVENRKWFFFPHRIHCSALKWHGIFVGIIRNLRKNIYSNAHLTRRKNIPRAVIVGHFVFKKNRSNSTRETFLPTYIFVFTCPRKRPKLLEVQGASRPCHDPRVYCALRISAKQRNRVRDRNIDLEHKTKKKQNEHLNRTLWRF